VKRIVLCLGSLLALIAPAGCGSGSAKYVTYVDSRYHFSFQHPAAWHGPAHGKDGMADGVPSYIVHFSGPGNGFRVVVNGVRPDYSTIANGEVVSHQSGCPQVCTYYRTTISHLPALLVTQATKGVGIDYEYAFVNGLHYGYDLEIANTRGLSGEQKQSFAHVLRTFRIAPGG
jgi:hypothetical protein